jgi:hypothetical protein
MDVVTDAGGDHAQRQSGEHVGQVERARVLGVGQDIEHHQPYRFVSGKRVPNSGKLDDHVDA